MPGQLLLLAAALLIGSPDGHTQNTYEGKRAPMYSPVREADVMWMKCIWRRIDLRQKMNHPFYFPERATAERKSLFDYLKTAVMDGSIVAYDPGPLGDDDLFTKPLTVSEVRKLLYRKDTVYTPVLTDPDQLMPQEIVDSIRTADIIQYEIKEEWFFDRQRSVMEVRIVGICPVIYVKDESTGEFKGFKRLFWIDFIGSRSEMATWSVFNRWNDGEQRTYDEIFQKRLFASHIVKESNVYDRYINEYMKGEDALLESDKIHESLFTMEHDLWCH